ncbi:hypothetical protein CK203_097441 [Vitis vinifera]|uniref:Retrotransposon Copia-like N-terminal domain-containing protein n=1 Tax=Vitis vinifera TaxID=29760 RepID=A0A438BTS0_VITVI|nr:hypothetical protein CK203_097441 [Vitis vinifera]
MVLVSCDLTKQGDANYSESMADSIELIQPPNTTIESILDNLTTKMTKVLSRAQASSPLPFTDSPTVLGIKLDGSNYALWSQVVEMYILGKDKPRYINGDLPQPLETDPYFRKWWIENAIVNGWLINSMESSLVRNFICFPTTKQVWDSIATTYFDGSDTSQVYDLRRRVTRMWQGGESIEKYYNDAYAHVRREDTRQVVMISGVGNASSGVIMATKGVKPGKPQTLVKLGSSTKSKSQIDGGKCTHYGNTKHTRDTCLKLHWYPDWWHELQSRKKKDNTTTEEGMARAAMVIAEPQLSLIPMVDSSTTVNDRGNCGQVLCSSNTQNNGVWIIDSGATDHMTFDPSDFSHTTQP